MNSDSATIDQTGITNFAKFWPYYLAAHRKRQTQLFHLGATISSWLIIALAIASGNAWWLILIPFVAYGLAWFSHFFIEHNRPAAFGHPLYSLLADYKMAALLITGRLDNEFRRFERG